MATVYIGASSELEQKEKKDRVEDAILATQSALEEGIIPGGGMALYNLTEGYNLENDDLRKGINIVKTACKEPFKQILKNAGVDYDEVINQFNKPATNGYNVKTGKYTTDMIKEGIIDPTKVVRCALENAASVAKTLLTTEAIIYLCDENAHLAESIKMDPGNIN